ncbi:MAG: glycosyltransferase [Alicyclobacillus herbarius]|uniref:glycosyltransferase family 2 protein n=1 Tax=Alicyclobacillus herbarius TaxID=122960 RepID=UPI002355B9B4|nr:glycosyltransferase family 2 protein [Alicyclobacillus herbarius]MCL6631795.1 glycosyltransferase [Alicyclobacillus herbarius]
MSFRQSSDDNRVDSIIEGFDAKISVIVPMYNVEEYIQITIRELLQQSYKNVEYIFVDDGSTDSTYTIASDIAIQHPNIRVIRQKNKGPGAARNLGLKLATGDYICFVDSDDLLAPDALGIMHQAAIEHEADLVTGPMVRFDGRKLWHISSHLEEGVNNPGEKTIFSNPELLYAMGPCAKLYKRETLSNVYFPEDIQLGEDQPFVLQAYLNARRIYTVPSIIYYYRLREGDNSSLTQRALKDPVQSFRDLYKMVELSCKYLQNFPDLQSAYLARVIRCDIWPRCRAAVTSGDQKVQRRALESLRRWITLMDKSIFNSCPTLSYVVLVGTMVEIRHISRKNVFVLARLQISIFSKMHWHTYIWCVATGMNGIKRRMAESKSKRFFQRLRNHH